MTEPASYHPERPLTLVPGSLQRVREMQALRQEGWSLEEIGTSFEISRERVRQILGVHGGPDRQHVAEARRRRDEQLAEARVDELLTLWRAGEGLRAAAGRLGLRATACTKTIERFATDVDRAARRASMARAHGARTSSDRGRASTRRLRWTEAACWEALRRAVDDLGEVPTVLTYERYAAGRSDLPSSATIRNRLGRWSSLATRLAAQRELAEQAQVRPRAARRALAHV